MSIVIFIRGTPGSDPVLSKYYTVGVATAWEHCKRQFGQEALHYKYACWFDSEDEFLKRTAARNLWECIARGEILFSRTWEKGFRDHTWWNWDSTSLDFPVGSFDEFDTPVIAPPGPRKPIPQVPAEVWNTKKIDSSVAMSAMRDLCKGQAGA